VLVNLANISSAKCVKINTTHRTIKKWTALKERERESEIPRRHSSLLKRQIDTKGIMEIWNKWIKNLIFPFKNNNQLLKVYQISK